MALRMFTVIAHDMPAVYFTVVVYNFTQAAPMHIIILPTLKRMNKKQQLAIMTGFKQASYYKQSYTEGGAGPDGCAERSCRPCPPRRIGSFGSSQKNI